MRSGRSTRCCAPWHCEIELTPKDDAPLCTPSKPFIAGLKDARTHIAYASRRVIDHELRSGEFAAIALPGLRVERFRKACCEWMAREKASALA